MQPLGINLASRPFRNNTILWIAYGLGALFLIGFTARNVEAWLDHREKLDSLRSELSTVEQRLADLDRREREANAGIAKYDVKYLRVQADKANDVIARKGLSWTRLFNLIEGVMPYAARMTAIRPVYRAERTATRDDFRIPEGSVPVSVERMAQNLEAFYELETNLFADEHFDRVEPERAVRTEQGEIRFDLRFLYYPEGQPGGEKEEAPVEAPQPEAPQPEAPADVPAVEEGEA